MPPQALLLVLVAAAAHTGWNLLLKRAPGPRDAQARALGWAALAALGSLGLAWPFSLDATGALLVLVSASFETAYMFALVAAYGTGDLSLVYPVARGSASLLVLPLAVLLLGERPSPSGLAGIGLVLLGVLGGSPGLLARGGAGPARRRALGPALLTGAMTAGYSLVNKVAVRHVPVLAYGGLVFIANTLLVHAVMRARPGLPGPPADGREQGRAALIGLLMFGAYLAVLAALAVAPVTYVVAAREVSVVLAALVGALGLREPHAGRRLAAAAAILAGIVTIALSR